MCLECLVYSEVQQLVLSEKLKTQQVEKLRIHHMLLKPKYLNARGEEMLWDLSFIIKSNPSCADALKRYTVNQCELL